MNETIRRFGYPATLLADYEHWVILLRAAQPTLGSLVLAAKGEAEAFSELSPGAFAELGMAVADIEATLRKAIDYSKINYLMLMMVDPHVHFHVIPRYEGEREKMGLRFVDSGWPKAPALGEAIELDARETEELARWLKGLWPSAR